VSLAARTTSPTAARQEAIVRDLGRTEYRPVFTAMRDFTENRSQHTPDELWFTEHEPVFTQGQAGKAGHVLAAGDIPVVQTDRGGQVTYHGPGQIVGYLLFDLRRMGLSVRGLVTGIETAVIDVLAGYGIVGKARPDAPGVYVDGAKIAALGLRVRRHCSYHGLSFNIDMALEPFQRINPCGMTGLPVTQLKGLCGEVDLDAVKGRLTRAMAGSYPVNFRKPDRPGASGA